MPMSPMTKTRNKKVESFAIIFELNFYCFILKNYLTELMTDLKDQAAFILAKIEFEVIKKSNEINQKCSFVHKNHKMSFRSSINCRIE
jgi:hypothetical protein